MRAVFSVRAAALLAACALPFALTACDSLEPSDATSDALARQPKAELCHLDDEAGTYHLIEVAVPALDAHLAHGDGRIGGPVPDHDGFVFDDACQPLAQEVTVEACYTDNEDNSVKVIVDLMTGALTGTESCPYFGGNCAAGGTVTPTGVSDLGAVTGFTYTETNTLADPDGGGCDAGGPDIIETTFTRTAGDLFSGQALALCDGEPLDSGFSFTATLTEGACSTAARPANGFSPVSLSKSAWIEGLR